LIGGGGNDALSGGAGRDLIGGGRGNDGLAGGLGEDTLAGGMGRDTLSGGLNGDEIAGGSGDDWLLGGHGNDTLFGQAGNDLISGGAGADVIHGGEGVDTVSYQGATSGVVVSLGRELLEQRPGEWDGRLSYEEGSGSGGAAAGDLLYGIENVNGSKFADILSGNAADNILIGGKGVDVLEGGAGNDVFVFRKADGADVITGFQTWREGKGQCDFIRLEVTGIKTFSDVLKRATQTDEGVVIQIGATDSITLAGTKLKSLSSHDFLIA
jgi:Ca2+-binding RTX toxin-like protein